MTGAKGHGPKGMRGRGWRKVGEERGSRVEVRQAGGSEEKKDGAEKKVGESRDLAAGSGSGEAENAGSGSGGSERKAGGDGGE